ncbi:MAG: hypothetical protein DDG60_02020 [Anaerolineae bacterium]|nr:MAG: hypothetical protein DDG60_02020 [Anaerolineae bacterium]
MKTLNMMSIISGVFSVLAMLFLGASLFVLLAIFFPKLPMELNCLISGGLVLVLPVFFSKRRSRMGPQPASDVPEVTSQKQASPESHERTDEDLQMQRRTLPAVYQALSRPQVSTSFRENSLIRVLLSLGVLFFFVWALALFVQDVRTYVLLTQSGVATRARITNMYTESSEWTEYYISYQFDAPVNGASVYFRATSQVSSSYFNQVKNADSIEIKYYPLDPTISHPASDLSFLVFSPTQCLTGFVFTFLVFAITLYTVYSIYGYIMMLRLRREGQIGVAVVFDEWTKWKRDSDSGDIQKFYYAYAYYANQPNGGLELFTRAEECDENLYARLQIGSSWPVRYLPENPNIAELLLNEQEGVQANSK